MVRHLATMPKKPTRKRPTDPNLLAAAIVAEVTGSAKAEPEKNPAAVALGRMGGLKGGKARAAKLSKKRRSDIARKAAKSRWGRPDE
jgi:hypothetical protein